MSFTGIGISSGELIAKYGPQQSDNVSDSDTLSLFTNNIIINELNDRGTYYSQNSFKRHMGYTEPDYLMVAGLYASVESSKKSKPYGNFLVKRADYVAQALGWYNGSMEPDTERAENAIRTACRKTAPNGFRYMYTMSNKNHCLSKQGGSRIYMSGRRYQELQDEQAYLRAKYDNADTQRPISSRVPFDISPYQRIKYIIEEVAKHHHLLILSDGGVKGVAKLFIEELGGVANFNMSKFEWYCDLITSKWYHDQLEQDRYCPQFLELFDIFNKYDKILTYYERLK